MGCRHGLGGGGGALSSPQCAPLPAGSGTSKKLAKRNAAAKMLVRIHNVPMEPREGSEAEVEEDQFCMVWGVGAHGDPRGGSLGALRSVSGRGECRWLKLRGGGGSVGDALWIWGLREVGGGSCSP